MWGGGAAWGGATGDRERLNQMMRERNAGLDDLLALTTTDRRPRRISRTGFTEVAPMPAIVAHLGASVGPGAPGKPQGRPPACAPPRPWMQSESSLPGSKAASLESMERVSSRCTAEL